MAPRPLHGSPITQGKTQCGGDELEERAKRGVTESGGVVRECDARGTNGAPAESGCAGDNFGVIQRQRSEFSKDESSEFNVGGEVGVRGTCVPCVRGEEGLGESVREPSVREGEAGAGGESRVCNHWVQPCSSCDD